MALDVPLKKRMDTFTKKFYEVQKKKYIEDKRIEQEFLDPYMVRGDLPSKKAAWAPTPGYSVSGGYAVNVSPMGQEYPPPSIPSTGWLCIVCLQNASVMNFGTTWCLAHFEQSDDFKGRGKGKSVEQMRKEMTK